MESDKCLVCGGGAEVKHLDCVRKTVQRVVDMYVERLESLPDSPQVRKCFSEIDVLGDDLEDVLLSLEFMENVIFGDE